MKVPRRATQRTPAATMRQIFAFWVLCVVSRIAQTTTSNHLSNCVTDGEHSKSVCSNAHRTRSFQKGPLAKPVSLPRSLFELTAFTRGSHQSTLKRWFRRALGRITHVFHPRKLHEGEFKKEAIKDYANRYGLSNLRAVSCVAFPDDPEFRSEYYTLCQAFPEEEGSLCRHLAKWVHNELLKLKRNCQANSTAAQCLAEFRIPLTHPLVTERRPDATGQRSALSVIARKRESAIIMASSPYVVRQHLLSADTVHRLRFRKDTIGDTQELFDSVISKASTIYLLMNGKLNHHIRKWSKKAKSSTEKRSLLHVMAGAPVADPVVMRLLWSMTTRKCAEAARRRIHIYYKGAKVNITGQEALTVFWSELVRGAIRIDEEDCMRNVESNCAILKIYLQYKTHLYPQLQKAASGDDFVGHALRIISQTQNPEELQGTPDVHAFDRLAQKCRDTAAADLLYGFQTSKVKFGKVINFIVRHKWSRKILVSLVRKSVRQMLRHPPTSGSLPGTLTTASPRSPEQVVALALYYGFKSGSETWALTGNKGLGELADHIIRRQVAKMWTNMHPESHSAHVSYPSSATSFIHYSSPQAQFFRWHLPEKYSKAKAFMLYADLEQFGRSKLSRPELALVEKEWSPTKRRVVVGVSGIVLVFIAISGLTGGAVTGLMLPLLMLFAGLCMCLYAVVSSLKSEGLILSSEKSTDGDEGAADEEE